MVTRATTNDGLPLMDQVEHLYGRRCRATLERHFEITAPSPRELRLVNTDGPGAMTMRQFSGGLVVGRGNYRLNHGRDLAASPISTGLGFSLLLSGRFDVTIPDLGLREAMLPGRVWSRCGALPALHAHEPAGIWISGLSLDLPPDHLEAWREDGLLGSLPPDVPFAHVPGAARRGIAATAAQIMAVDDATPWGRLKLESLALDLLSSLLADPDGPAHGDRRRAGPGARRPAVEEAADILTAEMADPPTITALARRVGMNECYLKRQFRERFGLTIGDYVRTLRMHHALQCLKRDSCTVQQAAALVGYTNASHFAAAFRTVHGCAPSAVRRRR